MADTSDPGVDPVDQPEPEPAHPAEPDDELRRDYHALSEGAAVRVARDVLRASGPDATEYLQGQLSQDVASLADGASAWTWLLQPA
ncbi:MAG: hypothetical protein ACRDZY_22550, partial [Acidimicrobiales bacterium]